MLLDTFRLFFDREFGSVLEAAQYFHVKPITVKRWLSGQSNPPAAVEKLLLIKARGYLPNDMNWCGFYIVERRGILVTPDGREFAPRELEFFTQYRDQNRQYLKQFGELKSVPNTPPMENPTRKRYNGGNRAAYWIPPQKV